jgi:hypothetical protein
MHAGNSDEYYEFLDNTIALNLAIAEIEESVTTIQHDNYLILNPPELLHLHFQLNNDKTLVYHPKQLGHHASMHDQDPH